MGVTFVKRLTVTRFRQNLFKYLDRVIHTGIPIELERKGKIIKIIIEKPKSKLGNLESHDYIAGDPADLLKIDWSKEWSEENNL
jgi:hypothetical protein